MSIEDERMLQERMLQRLVHDWVRDKLFEKGYEYDVVGVVPPELRKELVEIGVWGMSLLERYNEDSASTTDTAIVASELAFGLPSLHLFWSANTALAGYPIATFGTEQQKSKYLPKMAKGEIIGSYALTEPDVGSDAAASTLRATFDPKLKCWRLNGRKMYITNAREASIAVVFARVHPDDLARYMLYKAWVGEKPKVFDILHHSWGRKYAGITAFLVGSDRRLLTLNSQEGVTVIDIPKWPMPACPFAEISFEDTPVGSEALLGRVGEGFYIAMETLNNGRINIAAQAVGIARRALYEAEKYGKSRRIDKGFSFPNDVQGGIVFDEGVAILDKPEHAHMLAELTAETEQAWQFTLEAARAKDAGDDYRVKSALAKLYASEAAFRCALFNLDIQGGFGQTKDSTAWMIVHDAHVTRIYEGTSDIQRLVIEKGTKSH